MFLMPKIDKSTAGQLLALNHNTRTLVIDVFEGTEAYRRTERSMKAATGGLQTRRSEDRRVEVSLRKARVLASQFRISEAEKMLDDLLKQFPGRGDIYGTLAWVNKKSENHAEARLNFKRAHELGFRDRDVYWHWSEMEANSEEWRSSADAAELGLAKFPGDQGLLFRHGYALHRMGKELSLEFGIDKGASLCHRAKQVLESALNSHNAEERNFAIRGQIYRAIVLNLEVLDEPAELSRYFAEWSTNCPGDPNRGGDYERLREKYPQYLRQH